MYKLSGHTRNDTDGMDPMLLLEQEVEKMRVLVERLKRYHPLIENVGFISDEAGDYAERMMERYANSDEGFPDEVMEELDRLGEWPGRILLLEQPKKVLSIVQKQSYNFIEKYDSPTVSARISTVESSGISGELSRSVFWKSRNFGSVSFGFPMHHKNDVWFQDWHLVRGIMGIFMELWEFSWLTVAPSMYNSAAKYIGGGTPLFDSRASFGWMGYTSEILTDTGDALARVEPMRGGTFMLLQEKIMTLHKPDIEACNKAEAFLADRGILPVLG